jgi:hypothetical protein
MAALLSDRTPLEPLPPLELIQLNHLGPLAYLRGVAACRDEYAASAVLAARRWSLLLEIVGTLRPRGIRVALIKGIAYAGTLYPDPAERPMNDIDLLVPARQIPDAMHALLDAGFARVGMSRKLSGYYHALAFSRAGMMVELHRNIIQPYRTRFHAGDLWARATPDPMASGGERLDRVDELLLCALHIARHELAVPGINYVDIRRAWSSLSARQRDLVHVRAARARISKAVRAVLSMTELLASATSGRPCAGPGEHWLPTTDEVLSQRPPSRWRQLGQKASLTEGPRELAGLAYAYAAAQLAALRAARN